MWVAPARPRACARTAARSTDDGPPPRVLVDAGARGVLRLLPPEAGVGGRRRRPALLLVGVERGGRGPPPLALDALLADGLAGDDPAGRTRRRRLLLFTDVPTDLAGPRAALGAPVPDDGRWEGWSARRMRRLAARLADARPADSAELRALCASPTGATAAADDDDDEEEDTMLRLAALRAAAVRAGDCASLPLAPRLACIADAHARLDALRHALCGAVRRCVVAATARQLAAAAATEDAAAVVYCGAPDLCEEVGRRLAGAGWRPAGGAHVARAGHEGGEKRPHTRAR